MTNVLLLPALRYNGLVSESESFIDKIYTVLVQQHVMINEQQQYSKYNKYIKVHPIIMIQKYMSKKPTSPSLGRLCGY